MVNIKYTMTVVTIAAVIYIITIFTAIVISQPFSDKVTNLKQCLPTEDKETFALPSTSLICEQIS